MSSSQPPPTPRQKKVQDALELFAQLQGVPFVVVDDEQRVRHAANLHRETSAASSSAAAGGGGGMSAPSNMLKKGSGTGGGAAPSLATTKQLHQQIKDLEKKVAMGETLMKKLHRKNRELLAQIEGNTNTNGGNGNGADEKKPSSNAATMGGGGPRGAPTTFGGAAAADSGLSTEQLKSIILKRDQEIMALRRQLQQQQQQQNAATGAGSTTLATTTADSGGSSSMTPRLGTSGGRDDAAPSPAPSTAYSAASPSRPNTNTNNNLLKNVVGPNQTVITIPSNTPIEAHVGLLHKRIDTLQRDYQQLLDSRLDAISQGESTGKVNKQVKTFFAAVKAKIASDVADYEGERALWHQRVAAVGAAANSFGGGSGL